MATLDFAWTDVRPAYPVGALRSIKTFGRVQPHVLIVDDHAAGRAICAAYCDLFDFSSEAVGDGLEALEAARRTRFDIILMDIEMPRMDGLEAARAIRALRGPAANTPIIGITDSAGVEDVHRSREHGVWSLVAKPVTASSLFAAMNAALWADAPEPRSWAPLRRVS